MNYRHAYHAGNPGDVLKHAVLARVIGHLTAKDAPFRLFDTHAGRGVYDLAGVEAEKTGEWREGIGALLDAPPEGAAGEVLAPYVEVIRAMNPDGPVRRYPGSPELALRLSRRQDRLVLYELHPDDGRALARRYAGERRVRVEPVDGWAGVVAALPPTERRGVVLIDPPYEDGRDYVRLTETLSAAHRRFATGVYLLWYPVKGTIDVRGLRRGLAETGIAKILRAELHRRTPNHPGRFDGAGLVIVNPPWTLEADLSALLPVLAERFATGPGAGFELDWIAGE